MGFEKGIDLACINVNFGYLIIRNPKRKKEV
jgi:hypothetical protein